MRLSTQDVRWSADDRTRHTGLEPSHATSRRCASRCALAAASSTPRSSARPERAGYPKLRDEAPQLAVLATALIYALPMAAWMLFRGMDPRTTLEMSLAAISVGGILIGAAALGIINSCRAERLGQRQVL